jgi:D-alanyl-D-alanine-carboxypeptidase/D-alanyl-D-alanine-endopeptidase
MGWGAAMAAALSDTFAGWDGHTFPVAAAAIESGESAATFAGAEDLLFEIGSITKTLTATLLAARVTAGDVTLDDPISRWIDAGVNADITLGQLATHTSGLPRLAPNWRDVDGFHIADPYAGFTETLVERGVNAAERSNVGTAAYSNFGFQLLGLIVARIAGVPFAELVRRDIFDPLGMQTARLTGWDGPQAQGHDSGRPVSHWHNAVPGAGGIEATIGDMAAYARAVLDPPDAPVGRAIALATATPLAWVLQGDVLWHNGGTGGFRSMLGVDRSAGRAAVLLLAHADIQEADDAVRLALRGEDPSGAKRDPAGPEWGQRALEIAAILIAREWADLRGVMGHDMREVLTADVLDAAWTEVMGARGTVESIGVASATRSGSSVKVGLSLVFPDAVGEVDMTFDPDKVLVSLLIR